MMEGEDFCETLVCVLCVPDSALWWIYHRCLNEKNALLLSCYIRILFLAATCFGHSCDHLQGVPQCKCQEHNRSHVKCMKIFSKVLCIIKIVYSI